MSLDKDEVKVPMHKTIKRLQKHFLVRCNDSLSTIIPGSGVKPVSQIRRVEREIRLLRKELGQLTEQELLSQMDSANNKKVKNVTELNSRRVELTEMIKKKERELL